MDKEQALFNAVSEGKVQCPYCGSRKIAWILRGMPAWSEELEARMRDGTIVFAGCDADNFGPRCQCRNCDRVFGSLQVTRMGGDRWDERDGKELLLSQDTVVGVNYSIGGFFGGHDSVSIIREGDSGAIMFSHLPAYFKETPFLIREFSGTEWKRLSSKLFQKYFCP